MIDIREYRISAIQLSDASCTEWSLQDKIFLEPTNADEADALRHWSHSLRNGDIVRVRGRDCIAYSGDNLPVYEPWGYGLALKMGSRFFLLWDSEVESILIDGCNFMHQLHFECRPILNLPTSDITLPHRSLTVVLCHGFCPEDGPHYALMCVLKHALTSAGYRVIIPDFRQRYFYFTYFILSIYFRCLVLQLQVWVSSEPE
jgi:hypothetical protein